VNTQVRRWLVLGALVALVVVAVLGSLVSR